MRINRVSIQNFRSIEDVTFAMPQICAIIGPNNSGKSNLLEGLRRILGTSWVSASSFTLNDIFMRDAERDVRISS
jgi:putative ATP-dependent endonuclease of OLD family